MSKYIATKLHQLIEGGHGEPLYDRMLELPHYVIDDRLVELFQREDIVRSIVAVIEADVAYLPYHEMVVEYDVKGERTFRVLARLRETTPGVNGDFLADIVLHTEGMTSITREPVRMRTATDPAGIDVAETWSKSDQVTAAFALMIALLMLNIQGIDKEVIEPERLNKSRKASGKPGIPRHTLLHIGTVLNSEGHGVRFGEGRHMPVHLRAGHVRHQAHGPGMTERKLIYIPPVLVNFHPGDDVKQPKRVLTR